MATLDKASIIAVSSVGGFIGLVLIAALISYCYRRREVELKQRKKAAAVAAARKFSPKNGNFNGPIMQNSYVRSPPRSPIPVKAIPVYARPVPGPRMSQVYNTTTRVPGGGYYSATPMGQPNRSSGFYVHSMGGNYKVHKMPIRSLVPQSSHAFQSRPAPPRRPMPDFTYEIKRPGTAPPLRLGSYRPKVIHTNYFSPHNVREAFFDWHESKSGVDTNESLSPKSTSQSSNAFYEKEGYSGYKERGTSWYSKQTEVVVGTIDLEEEDGQSKKSTSSPKESPTHLTPTVIRFDEKQESRQVSMHHGNNKPVTKQQTHLNNKNVDFDKDDYYNYVIVDYLDETLKSTKSSHVTGPLVTSTPRYVEQTLTIPRRDSDSGVESLENKRQRHPHDGSLEDLPND